MREESVVYRRQILTYKDGPRAERVNNYYIRNIDIQSDLTHQKHKLHTY